MIDRAELQKASEALSAGLAQALTTNASFDDVVDRAAHGDQGGVVLRMHGYEIVACSVVAGRPLNETTMRSVLRARESFHIDTTSRRACVTEHAFVLLARQLGAVVDLPAVPDAMWEPPLSWFELGAWAVDIASFAIPAIAATGGVAARVAAHALDVTRRAVLATLESDYMLASQLLRWLPYCDHPQLRELETFVRIRSSHPYTRLLFAITDASKS